MSNLPTVHFLCVLRAVALNVVIVMIRFKYALSSVVLSVLWLPLSHFLPSIGYILFFENSFLSPFWLISYTPLVFGG